MRRGKTIGLIISVLLIGMGVLIAIWPYLQQHKNQSKNNASIKEYETAVSQLTEQQLNAMYVQAEKYNVLLQKHSGREGDYNDLLCVGTEKIMGIVSIPKLDVYLPIYHGTSDAVLSKGVGHLEGSSLPTGDSTGHVVLCGHSGLPSLYVFDDIDSLEQGDKIYVQVLDQVYAYAVADSVTVLPAEVDAYIDVSPAEGGLLTLLTCTPYGTNSHRLLVRCTQLPDKEVSELIDKEINIKGYWILGIIGVFGVLLIALKMHRRKGRKQQIEKDIS